jgi:carbamoyl-phosphate synthase large subunit
VPFVSKATGIPLARIAARCMTGQSLADQGITEEYVPKYYSVKEAVFPFVKFPGVDPLLGPEMKSTGEVMGIGRTFGEAYGKAQSAAGSDLPHSGHAFISVRETDKSAAIDVARDLHEMGFVLFATRGTAKAIETAGIPCTPVHKVQEGGRPHIVDKLKDDEIDLIINTTDSSQALKDSRTIRSEAVRHKVTYATTIAGARAMVLALKAGDAEYVYCLQALHRNRTA